MLSSFKIKLYAFGFAVLGVLLAVIRFLSVRNSRLEREVDTAQANIKRRQIVAEADVDIEKTEKKIRERIKTDSVDAARKPNSLWDNTDD